MPTLDKIANNVLVHMCDIIVYTRSVPDGTERKEKIIMFIRGTSLFEPGSRKIFDLDKVQAVRHGTWCYSYLECEPDEEIVPLSPKKEQKSKSEEEPQLEKLKDYISIKYGS